MDALDRAARKLEEFPDDEKANIELEVAEARLDAITGAGDEVIQANVAGIKNDPVIKEIM
jgi:hypothetical protein